MVELSPVCWPVSVSFNENNPFSDIFRGGYPPKRPPFFIFEYGSLSYFFKTKEALCFFEKLPGQMTGPLTAIYIILA